MTGGIEGVESGEMQAGLTLATPPCLVMCPICILIY